MFTGIVIGTGTVVAVEPRGEAARRGCFEVAPPGFQFDVDARH